MYAKGRGVAPDLAQAVQWYRKAAEQGEADGQFNLGDAYANGTGVKPDPPQAMPWRIENGLLHKGAGALNPIYLKSKGRYYLTNAFQFATGGPDNVSGRRKPQEALGQDLEVTVGKI